MPACPLGARGLKVAADFTNIIPGALNPIGCRDRIPETGRLETAIRDGAAMPRFAEEAAASFVA